MSEIHEQSNEEIKLIHCIYASAGTEEFTPQDIVELLDKAKENNSKLDVTGMLLYEDGSFFQVLEGEYEAVSKLFKKIALDKRHEKIIKIIQEPIEERLFGDWTMGYSGISKNDLKDIEGLNDFFSSRQCYTELDSGRAKKLLAAFKDGKWRASLK